MSWSREIVQRIDEYVAEVWSGLGLAAGCVVSLILFGWLIVFILNTWGIGVSVGR